MWIVLAERSPSSSVTADSTWWAATSRTATGECRTGQRAAPVLVLRGGGDQGADELNGCATEHRRRVAALDAGDGHVLITSRNPAWGVIATCVSVPQLSGLTHPDSIQLRESHAAVLSELGMLHSPSSRPRPLPILDARIGSGNPLQIIYDNSAAAPMSTQLPSVRL